MPSTARLSQSVAIAASAVGLFCACGIGFHNNAPPPPPLDTALSLTTYNLTFDTRAIETQSPPQQIVLTNIGSSPLNLAIRPPAPNPNFDIDVNPCLTELAPDQTCTITVIFHPKATGVCIARLFLHTPGFEARWLTFSGVGVRAPEPKPSSP